MLDSSALDGGLLDGSSTLNGGMLDGGTLRSGPLSGGSLDGGMLDGGPLRSGPLSGGSLDGSTLDGSALTGGAHNGSSFDGSLLDGGTLKGSTLEGSLLMAARSVAARPAAARTEAAHSEMRLSLLLPSPSRSGCRRHAPCVGAPARHKHRLDDGTLHSAPSMSGRPLLLAPLLLRAYPRAQPWYRQVVGNADAAECGEHVAGCGRIRRAKQGEGSTTHGSRQPLRTRARRDARIWSHGRTGGAGDRHAAPKRRVGGNMLMRDLPSPTTTSEGRRACNRTSTSTVSACPSIMAMA
tara:strand:+ start:819 stop:1703 length:885 start_codon:yes stop_codon:yes gene_type:complete